MKKMSSEASVLDMTRGNPIRLILAFAVPLFIGNIFQQVYSMVDTMVAGYCLGDTAIAAIGATGSLYNLIVSLAWGLNSGFALVITQSFGAHDARRVKKAIAGTFLLDMSIAAMLTVLALAFLKPLMRLMNTPEAIMDQAYSYMIVICGGMLATIAYNMFAGVMRAFGNSRTSLYVLIFCSLVNIGLDLLFVAVLGMGVGGAALATVIAQMLSGAICGFYVRRSYGEYLPEKADFRVEPAMLRELLSTGSAMAFMYSIVNLGTAIFQGAINRLGEVSIAAYTAGERIIGMLMQPTSTIMDASATFVGQNWGAKAYDRIRDGLKRAMVMEMLWGMAACAIVYVAGGTIIRFTTGTRSAEIVALAVRHMRVVLPFFPVLGMLLVLRTAMQAMGQKLAPVLSSGLELVMKIIGAAWMIPAMGFGGIGVNIAITWSVMTAYLGLVYLMKTRGRMREIALNEKNINQPGTKALACVS